MSCAIFENDYTEETKNVKKTIKKTTKISKEDAVKKLVQQKQDTYNCYQSSYLPIEQEVQVEQSRVVEQVVEDVPDSWDEQFEDDGNEVILNMDQEPVKKVVKKTKKTIPCKFGKSCKREVCNFAHSIEELDIVKCKRGNQCLNEKCIFYHPCDTYEQHFERLLPQSSPKKEEQGKKEHAQITQDKQDKTKTAMCSFGKDCKRQVCHFAHTLDELRVFECTFKHNCHNGDRCTYFHPERESKEEFVERKFGKQIQPEQQPQLAPKCKTTVPPPQQTQPVVSQQIPLLHKVSTPVQQYPPLPAPWARPIMPMVLPPQVLPPQVPPQSKIVIQCSKENFMEVLKQVQGQQNVQIQIV
jgi:hypothetical protein